MQNRIESAFNRKQLSEKWKAKDLFRDIDKIKIQLSDQEKNQLESLFWHSI